MTGGHDIDKGWVDDVKRGKNVQIGEDAFFPLCFTLLQNAGLDIRKL
jgi:hypothetical protein